MLNYPLVSCIIPDYHTTSSSLRPATMAALKHSMRHLKQLTLSVGGSDTWYADQVLATHRSGHIARLIRPAVGLETLCLDVDGMETPEMLFGS